MNTIIFGEGEIALVDSSISEESFHSDDEKPMEKDICLKYINNKSIVSWYFLQNKSKEQQMDFQDSIVSCKNYAFNRIVISYSAG